MNIDPNSPAFPTTTARDTGSKIVHEAKGGITIRAEIASRVLAGLAAHPVALERYGNQSESVIACMKAACAASVIIADALIEVLNATGKEPA